MSRRPESSQHDPWCAQADADVVLRVKAVPGAKRDAIVGLLGDRLKIRVAAPPEGGRANDAIIRLVADALGRPAKSVTLDSGATSPEKLLRIRSARAGEVAASLLDRTKDA